MRIYKASRPEKERQKLKYNTETNCEVIGKGGHIYHQWNGKSNTLDGALAGMESENNLPMVEAMTATDTPTGTKLLDIRVSAYDDSPDQDEFLANPNVFDCNINERSKHRDGRQSLLTDSGGLPIYL